MNQKEPQTPIHFFLPMIPPTVTAQERRFTVTRSGARPKVYESETLKDTRRRFIAHLSRHVPQAPFTGPVRLVTKWLFPAGWSHPPRTYRTSRPDTDNLIKLFKDCMTRCGYWKDDAQVASEITEKFYNDLPGIYVRIDPLPEDVLEEKMPAKQLLKLGAAGMPAEVITETDVVSLPEPDAAVLSDSIEMEGGSSD